MIGALTRRERDTRDVHAHTNRPCEDSKKVAIYKLERKVSPKPTLPTH